VGGGVWAGNASMYHMPTFDACFGGIAIFRFAKCPIWLLIGRMFNSFFYYLLFSRISGRCNYNTANVDRCMCRGAGEWREIRV